MSLRRHGGRGQERGGSGEQSGGRGGGRNGDRGGGRHGGRGGGGDGDAHVERERMGIRRDRGGDAPPHQEEERAFDFPESSSSTQSRVSEERLHIGSSPFERKHGRIGRGKGDDALPHQEEARASDLPESSSSTRSRVLEERLYIGSSSGRQASTPETPCLPPLVFGSFTGGYSDPPSSSEYLARPCRPALGTAGSKCKVRANHFRARAENIKISQYEFKILPEVKSKALGRALMKKFVEQYCESDHRRLMPAYDGRNIFYVAGSLPFHSKDFALALSDRDGRSSKKFDVSIRFTKDFDLNLLHQFLRAGQSECPYDVIAALDVALRETPSNKYVTISRSFFSSSRVIDISGGLECWQGYFQSLRPTQMGLSLNFDISATSFYKSVDLIDFVVAYLKTGPKSSWSLTESERLEIEKALKGVRVETTHLPKVRIRYKITGITSQSAKELTFTLDNVGKTTVEDYFTTVRKRELKYGSLPCIKAGSDSKPKYLPLEVCKIVSGQRYIKKLNDTQVSKISNETCQHPTVRERRILELVNRNDYKNDAYTKEFGIAVVPKLTEIDARVLKAPTLKYHDSGPDKTCDPNLGQWRMWNKQFYKGAIVNDWACLTFSERIGFTIIHKFCKNLASKCNEFGMKFNADGVDERISKGESTEIRTNLKKVHKQRKQLQLLIIILPDIGSSYGTIKTICETELGLVTQCCLPKRIVNPNSQYLENLAMKINVKTGGCNTALAACLNKQMPLITSVPTIIFGADVTHPAAGEDSPSIAAVVASMDWPEVTKYRCLLSAQRHRQEIIEDLYRTTADPQNSTSPKGRGMIWEMLNAFRKEKSCNPERIIFYRDGVSEGQFNEVLNSEVTAIQNACKSFGGDGYRPRITFIVVQKRHHTRLFLQEQTKKDTKNRSGNIYPGTVVDTSICHRTEFDFYLCSHAGIQGTSRPAHYHVLFDENECSSDALQQLTYNLCYTYCRCTRSVSIVPPAYYAHLAAARARYYMEAETDRARRVTGQPTAIVPTLPTVKDNVMDVMFYC